MSPFKKPTNIYSTPGEFPKNPILSSKAATISEGVHKRRNVIRQFPDVGIGGTGQDWRVFTVTQGLELNSLQGEANKTHHADMNHEILIGSWRDPDQGLL